MLNLYFIDLFIFWRVQVMQLNFKNIGNNSCTTQGKIWNKCTKKSLNPLKITGNSTFIENIVKLNEKGEKTEDPNVPLCSSSAVVLRKKWRNNMSRWSILPFTQFYWYSFCTRLSSSPQNWLGVINALFGLFTPLHKNSRVGKTR